MSDEQEIFGPNSEPHGWTVLEVLTRDLYGALKIRTTVRAKDNFVDLSIEEYVGKQGRAKRSDVRLGASAVEAMRATLAAQPVSAPDAAKGEQ
jgi:hypothetical protein